MKLTQEILRTTDRTDKYLLNLPHSIKTKNKTKNVIIIIIITIILVIIKLTLWIMAPAGSCQLHERYPVSQIDANSFKKYSSRILPSRPRVS